MIQTRVLVVWLQPIFAASVFLRSRKTLIRQWVWWSMAFSSAQCLAVLPVLNLAWTVGQSLEFDEAARPRNKVLWIGRYQTKVVGRNNVLGSCQEIARTIDAQCVIEDVNATQVGNGNHLRATVRVHGQSGDVATVAAAGDRTGVNKTPFNVG